MMAQIPSDLHGVGIKLNITQPRIVYNVIKIRIMLEFWIEDGQFQVLFILSLALISIVKYRFNQLWTLTPLMEKLDACTSVSRKLRLYSNTWKH